ncbi:MAG: translocation protein TolB [bacterium ADurb.Bin429]|nr:MAG: translocation protein TolB [bacterium ADurb.Bin429]
MIRCLLLVSVCLVLTALPIRAQEMISVEAPDVLGFPACAMVPAAPLAELTQAQVKTADGALTFTRQGRSFSCTTGSTVATANGKKVTLPLVPFARAQVTYIPLRACVEALGGTLTVNAARTVAQVKLPNLAQPVELPFVPMVTDDGEGKTIPLRTNDFQDESNQLYVMNPDGTNERRLSYCAQYSHTLPVISANGERWLYMQSPYLSVLTLPYGSVYSRITAQSTSTCLLYADEEKGPVAFCADMTADGKTVWYSVLSGTKGKRELTIMRAPFTGGKPERIVSAGGWGTFDISADGNWLVYEALLPQQNDDPQTEMRVRNIASGKEWSLGAGRTPRMSADGRNILYYRTHSIDENKTVRLVATCMLDPTREIQQVIAVTDAHDMDGEDEATFTPDGNRILFVRQNNLTGYSYGVFVMNIDRSNCKQLTHEWDNYPIASPDGTYLYFTRNHSLFESNAYRMRFDGSELTQLTHGGPLQVITETHIDDTSTLANYRTKKIHSLAFSPDGSKLYFTAQSKAWLSSEGED